MKKNTSSASATVSVRVRVTIGPFDHALSGIYQRLLSMTAERERSNYLRHIIFSKEHVPQVTPDGVTAANWERIGSISVRVTVSSRDLGLKDLFDALFNSKSDYQRRLALRHAIEKTQLTPKIAPVAPTQKDERQTQSTIEIQIRADHDHGTEIAQQHTQAGNIDIGISVKKPNFKNRMREASRMFDL